MSIAGLEDLASAMALLQSSKRALRYVVVRDGEKGFAHRKRRCCLSVPSASRGRVLHARARGNGADTPSTVS